MADDFTINIDPDLNEQEAARQADRLAEIFAGAFARAAPAIGRDLANQITAAFSRGTSGRGPRIVDDIIGDTRNIGNQARFVADSLGNITDGFERVGAAAREGIGVGESKVDELNAGLVALRERAEAGKRALEQVGADPALLANVDNILKRTTSSFRQLGQQIDEGFVNPNLLRGLEVNLEQANKAVFREVQQNAVLLKNLREQQRIEGNRANEEASRQAQARLQESRQANARFVVEQQGANSQLLAETRITGQRQVAAQQAAARTRIEIVRFTFRQIQVLERGIAGLFRATGTVAQSAARTTAAALGRIGNLFRRSNRQLNEGLNGALLARERSIDRSFERQTADIRGSLREQTVLLDRFERQASTGLVGAATGRSGLGRLFGVGAGIGGGFIIARQLREGFEESVNLTESLNAVRQIAGDAADEIIDFADDSVEALFLTKSAALEAEVGFASFGKSAGLGDTQLATFSNTLTQLATDLASFRNTSVEQAIQSLTSALAGEAEPIRRNYSVLLNEATLQQRAFTLGITDTIRKLEPQERVLAAYAEILAQTTDAQGDAARTSEDFANAAKQAGAAVTELFAVIIGGLKPAAETFLNVFNPAIIALTEALESGAFSEQLAVLRDGLIGVAVALGGLLVAKAAGEALQFLALGLRAALTPLGFVVVAVAAAGAAIGIFSQRSERFANILQGVVRGLRELAGRGLDLALAGLSALGQLLTNVVLPALAQLGRVIVGPVLRGLEIAIGFVVNVAVPAFTRLAMLLVENIVPALQATGRFITNTVVPALADFGRVAVSVLSSVVSFLEPAIAGFAALGEAIVLAFRTGDLSTLLGGLAAVAQGIGEVFANLGMMIYEALRPQVERAVSFISSAFNSIDFAEIGLRILEVVRLVGFVLGSIVSDPRFIQAIEAIALAAIAIGVKFAQGFAEGVISNLPELGRLIGGQLLTVLETAVEFAFNNPTVVVKAILALFAASAVLNAYRSAAVAAGDVFLKGFTARLAAGTRAAASTLSSRNLLLGFFGGAEGLRRQAQDVAKRSQAQLLREFQRGNRQLRALGEPLQILPPGGVTQQALDDLNQRLETTKTRLTNAGAEAAIFRDAATRAFSGFRSAAVGSVRTVFGETQSGLVQARLGFRNFALAAGDAFTALKASAAGIGQALGGAVLAGFGAVISGQQVGQGNTALGLAGILSSALAAGAATGRAEIALAVGALGLLSAAFADSGEEARIAAEKISSYTDILQANTDAADEAASLGRAVSRALADVSTEALQLAAESGFNAQLFAQRAVVGVGTAFDAISEIATGLGISSEALQEFRDNIRSGSREGVLFAFRNDEGEQFREELRKAGVSVEVFDDLIEAVLGERGSLWEAAKRSGALDIVNATGVERATRTVDTSLSDFERRVRETDAATVEAEEKVDGFFAKLRKLPSEAVQAFDLSRFFDEFGTFDLSAAIESLESFLQLGIEIEDQFKGLGADAFFDEYYGAGLSVGDLNRQLAESTAEVADEVSIYDQAMQDLVDSLLGPRGYSAAAEEAAQSTNLIKAAVSELNEQRTSRIRNQVEQLRSQLDDAREAADRARDALTSFITARYVNTAQASVDALIGNIGSIGSEIEDALLQGGVRGEAALRSAVGSFESQLAGIIQAGFDQGLRTQEEFQQLLAPLFAALDEEVGDSASRILSTTDFEFGITPRAGESLRDALNRALAGRQVEVGVQSLINAEAEVSRIEDLLNAQEAQLEVDVVFDANQIREALRAAGATAAQLEDVDAASVVAAQQTGLAATVANAPTNFSDRDRFPIEITPPPPNVNININGSQDPMETASAVDRVVSQRTATTGRIRAI